MDSKLFTNNHYLPSPPGTPDSCTAEHVKKEEPREAGQHAAPSESAEEKLEEPSPVTSTQLKLLAQLPQTTLTDLPADIHAEIFKFLDASNLIALQKTSARLSSKAREFLRQHPELVRCETMRMINRITSNMRLLPEERGRKILLLMGAVPHIGMDFSEHSHKLVNWGEVLDAIPGGTLKTLQIRCSGDQSPVLGSAQLRNNLLAAIVRSGATELHFDFDNGDVSNSIAKELGDRLAEGNSSMTSLSFANSRIRDEGAIALAGIKSLQRLVLQGNEVGDGAAENLAACKHLKLLDLAGNRFSQDGKQALLSIKKSNPGMELHY